MKAKKILTWVCGIAAVILAALLLLIGSFIYVTRYKISDIDAATSPDGEHEIVFQAVGELIPCYLDGITGVYQTPQGYYVFDADVEEFDKAFPPKEKLRHPGQIFD